MRQKSHHRDERAAVYYARRGGMRERGREDSRIREEASEASQGSQGTAEEAVLDESKCQQERHDLCLLVLCGGDQTAAGQQLGEEGG